jgi:hypothetical protein
LKGGDAAKLGGDDFPFFISGSEKLFDGIERIEDGSLGRGRGRRRLAGRDLGAHESGIEKRGGEHWQEAAGRWHDVLT